MVELTIQYLFNLYVIVSQSLFAQLLGHTQTHGHTDTHSDI